MLGRQRAAAGFVAKTLRLLASVVGSMRPMSSTHPRAVVAKPNVWRVARNKERLAHRIKGYRLENRAVEWRG